MGEATSPKVSVTKYFNNTDAHEPFQKCLLILLFVSLEKTVRSADVGYISLFFLVPAVTVSLSIQG